MTEHISCDCKCTLNITTCNSDQNWNNRTCQCECKNYCKCKENYSTCICENSKYSKIIFDTSVTDCDKIVIVIDIISTKKTNTIATNVTSTASINWHSNIVRDCYILHTVLLVIILILASTIICFYYAKEKCTIKKLENEFRIKNCASCYFDDIIKLEDFDLDNALIDKIWNESILIYKISYKTLIDPKPLRIRFDKIDGFVRICDGTRY